MTTPTRTDTGRASKALAASPWAVLAIATITGGLTGPGQTIGVSVFIDHFVDDLNLSRSQVSTAYLIGTLAGATALPFVGRFVDRRGVRIAQVVVGAAFALALVNMSLVNGLVWLAIGFFGIRCLGQGSLSLVATVTVTVAFRQRRGFALGLFSVGTAALMALVPVALGLIIDQVGWQNAWLVSAAAVALFVVPAGWFGLAGLPRGLSQEPHVGLVADVGPTVDRSYTRAEAVRTRSFWIITCVSSTAAMLSTALNFHQIDLLGEAGLSDGAAAAMFIPQVLGSTVAGLAFGYAADRVGAPMVACDQHGVAGCGSCVGCDGSSRSVGCDLRDRAWRKQRSGSGGDSVAAASVVWHRPHWFDPRGAELCGCRRVGAWSGGIGRGRTWFWFVPARSFCHWSGRGWRDGVCHDTRPPNHVARRDIPWIMTPRAQSGARTVTHMLVDQIRSDLTVAMNARDTTTTTTLRSIIAAIQEAEVSGTSAVTLTDDEVMKVLAAQAKRRVEAAEAFESGGAADRAAKERAELVVIETYLPQKLSDDELAALVYQVLAAEGLSEQSQMGMAMKAVNAVVAGRADGRAVAALVKSRLS